MIVKGRTIVVIGAGPGLGREVASAALRDGANVVIAAPSVANVIVTRRQYVRRRRDIVVPQNWPIRYLRAVDHKKKVFARA